MQQNTKPLKRIDSSIHTDVYNIQDILCLKSRLQNSIYLYCYCSVTQSCLTLCDPMDCSTPGLLVPHNLLKFAQVHVHCISSVQFSSVAQSCLTLCDPMNHSMLGFPVHHQLPEFTQTRVHWVGCINDVIYIL